MAASNAPPPPISRIIDLASEECGLTREQAVELAAAEDLDALMNAAQTLTLRGFGNLVSFSPKVFIPLTQLCRDVCHYCTFARPPGKGERAYLTVDEMVAIASAGAAAGCREALFTLGDKPELRYVIARQELASFGVSSTLEYLARAAQAVFEQTGLLPHLNPGLMTADDIAMLRSHAVSMGIMLETSSARLGDKGMPHHRSPDKDPARRLATLRAAGERCVPFTSGILIGIGETRLERVESLLAIREIHERFGHIQEVIVQNFRAKSGTRMALHPHADFLEHQWTIAVARLIFGPSMSIQAPPNLSAGNLPRLIHAGINDWGGISPITRDHVNPESPWPELAELAAQTRQAGRTLVPRLAVMPPYVLERETWIDPGLCSAVIRGADSRGYARADTWLAGSGRMPPQAANSILAGMPAPGISRDFHRLMGRASRGDTLSENEIVRLFEADGEELRALVAEADALRAAAAGDTVTFVVNRNINYTNVCSYRCGFCAFAKGRSARSLRGPAYDLPLAEIAERSLEAWKRGATEVCLQGGIHPDYDGNHYLDIARAVKRAVPSMHVHAFSPLEVTHGAQTLGIGLRDFLAELKSAGLATLPGTAAEILDDEIREIICPDKINTAQWLAVMRAAHHVGLRSTATIMFGHVDGPRNWARHLLAVRRLQIDTGGFTEFVPLPFVHMEAPIWRKGVARSGPTFREAVLMHAIARLALDPVIVNIQTSWVKMGKDGAAFCLRAGANDLGGTLMNESITRAAGGVNGQEQDPSAMAEIAARSGRPLRQRNTLYGAISHKPNGLPIGSAAGVPQRLVAAPSNPAATLAPST